MNTGFNYSRMGLAGNAGLADMENQRRWAEMESNRLDSEGKSAALGSLLGSLTGAGLAMYQANKKEADPTKVMDDPTQSDAAQEAKEAIRKRDIATGQTMSQKDEDNRWLQDNPMDKLVKQRGVVDYSNPFNLGGDWDTQLTSVLTRFPSRFFGGS